MLLKQTARALRVCTVYIISGDGELCAVCETVIQYVDSLLEENATVAEIEAALDKVCNFLPDTIKGQVQFLSKYGRTFDETIFSAVYDKLCRFNVVIKMHVVFLLLFQCNDFVKQYGPMIIQLILEAANPQKVCTVSKSIIYT